MDDDMAAGAPQISVVVPTYNRSAFVGRAVRSVLSQTTTDLEVVVVDDASDDDTESALAEIGDERIPYVEHSENRGMAAAFLAGIANSSGEFIAFLPGNGVFLSNF
jgi:glycosyltransferase involved in cell wall biosynthesis